MLEWPKLIWAFFEMTQLFREGTLCTFAEYLSRFGMSNVRKTTLCDEFAKHLQTFCAFLPAAALSP